MHRSLLLILFVVCISFIDAARRNRYKNVYRKPISRFVTKNPLSNYEKNFKILSERLRKSGRPTYVEVKPSVFLESVKKPTTPQVQLTLSNPSTGILDLIYRSYTKNGERGDSDQVTVGIDQLFQRFYTRTQDYVCNNVPFIGKLTCPNDISETKGVSPDKTSSLRDSTKPVKTKVSRPTITKKGQEEENICLDGQYVSELFSCFKHVDRLMDFPEAEKYCEEKYENGSLILGNGKASTMDLVLAKYDIVPQIYEIWIDRTGGSSFFENNEGLDMEPNRGNPASNKVLVLKKREKAYYQYNSPSDFNTFICNYKPKTDTRFRYK